ncbi:MAG: TonB-dependent receptor [Sphingopyxis sp.]|nr:TonB-dependent receptor [Sphingopyxis sp.]
MLLGSVALVGVGVPSVAIGQDVAGEPAAVDSGQVEDIVVTAQRRPERLQDVPVSVTALSGDTMAKQRIISASDLANVVPNLQSVSTVGDTTPIFALRGISMSDYSANQASPVATYYDEVYKGNFALLGVALYDLERVEVLRGPQGTLYGKNTTGGAVNLISAKPQFATSGALSAGYGNFNRFESSGFVNTALGEKVAARLAFTFARADGKLRNVSAGQGDLDAVREYGARLSLRYEPSPDAEFILRLSTSLQNPDNYGVIAEPGPFGIGGGVYAALNAADPVLNPLTDDFRTGLGRRELASDFTPKRRNRAYAAALTSSVRLSGGLQLVSVSSWDRGTLLSEEDTDGSALKALAITYRDRAEQVTQDVRLVGDGNGPVKYTLGGFFSYEKVFNATDLSAYQDIDFNLDGALDFNDCLAAGPLAGCRLSNSFYQKRWSWAAYADASYDLGGGFRLRGGLRYSHDRGRQYDVRSIISGSDGVPLANLIPGDPVDLDATTSQRFSKGNISGKIGIDYLTGGNLLYASYSRGYRAGSFAAQAFFAPSELTIARPEKVDSFEAGFKLDLLGRKLRLNGAGFYYRYRDQQFIDVNPDGTQVLLNLPRSRIFGAEVELVAKPSRSLSVSASLGLLDSKIIEGVVQGQSVAGNRLANAPALSLSGAIDWDALSNDAGTLSLHVDSNYVSRQEYDALNSPALSQGGYGLLGARVAFRTADDRLGIALWGKNLTDHYYFTSRIAIGSIGFNYNHVGAPRTYGVTLDAKF